MATQLQIINMALTRIGEGNISSTELTNTSTETAVKADLFWQQAVDELLVEGPERGWKFARKRPNVDVESTSITAFADYSGTVSGTTSVTAASHNLISGDYCTIDDTSNYDDDYEVVRIDDDTFYIAETFVADDATGTVYWTSEQYEYRYAIPSDCLKVISVQVGGVEIEDWVREGDYILTNEEDEDVDVVYIKQITSSDTADFPPHFVAALYTKLAILLAYATTQSRTIIEDLLNHYHTVVLPKAIAMDEKERYVQEESSSWVDVGNSLDSLE